MYLESLIGKSEQNRKKYDYYISLGYSVAAAQILSLVTYGDENVAVLVDRLRGKDVISSIHSWLRTRDEGSPMDAFRAFFEEKHPRPQYNDSGFHFSRPASISSPERNSSSAPDVFFDLNDDDSELSFEEPDVIMRSVVKTMSFRLPTSLLESLSTDAYDPIEEKNASSVFAAPTSTFRMTTSSASMGIVFNQIRSGRKVNLDQVRIEEILNYFDYEAEIPQNAKFHISTELLEKKGNKKILYINAQAAEEKKDHQNIVLLLDTSGSMSSKDEVTQEAIATVFSKLKTGDRISLITYGTEDHIVLEGYEIKNSQDKEYLMGVVLGIEIEGCTYGSAGIETAYRIGERYYDPDWNNQVILISDGDLNFGITDKHGLQHLIEEKKKSHLFLSVIGTGLYNYKDDKLEVLSKHGNGTYCVINSLEDVDESINKRFIALTNIIAKDVKAQVEFNPRFVKAYRLLGYENRQLNHEDFRNDAVISEPYGSGGHGIALYELEMNDREEAAISSDLKYQTPVLTDSDELGTISIRYKEPLGNNSYLIETAVQNTENNTQNAQLAYFLYCLSEKRRGSDKLDAYDEQFADVMITSRLYRTFTGTNKEKLEVLVNYLNNNAERIASPHNACGDLPF